MKKPVTSQRPEIGVYLRQTAPLVRYLKWLQVESFELINAQQALPRPDRVTVYLCNHGALLSPFPAPVLTGDLLLKKGEYDDLVVVSFFHRLVEFVPGLSPLFKHHVGHATPTLRSVSKLIALMKARRVHLLGTAPEGRSCIWSYDEPVGPFTRVGLMLAALESDADIVLAAQAGIERLGRSVRLPFGWTLPVEGAPRGLLLPWWYPGRRVFVQVKYQRYQPLMTAAERVGLTERDRREQLHEEFLRIRRWMIRLYRSIRGADREPRGGT